MTTSRYIGVVESPDGRWIASTFREGRLHTLGVFESEIEAARFRDLSVLAVLGSFAVLNFPDLDSEYAELLA